MLRLSCGAQTACAVSMKATQVRRTPNTCHAAPMGRTTTCRTGALRSTKAPLSALTPAGLMSELQAVAANIAATTPEAHTAKSSLSLRSITTYVNIMIAGSTQHVGKVPYYKLAKKNAPAENSHNGVQVNTAERCPIISSHPRNQLSEPLRLRNLAYGSKPAAAQTVSSSATSAESRRANTQASRGLRDSSTTKQTQEIASDKAHPDTSTNKADYSEQLVGSDPHAAFVQDPTAWASSLAPVLLPQACREMVYTFQDTPGQGAALDPVIHLESLLDFVMKQQARDYNQLAGCRGLHKSLACGCLEHSPTVCIYSLPPEGPSRTDLVIMSALSHHVAVMPVITSSGLTPDQGAACQELVSQLLKNPGAYVKGLETLSIVTPLKSDKANLEVPILLQEVGAEVSLGTIAERLTTDWVYELLDHAWEKYNTFCGMYETAGKSESSLLRSEVEGLGSMLFDADQSATRTAACRKEVDVMKRLLQVVQYAARQGYRMDLSNVGYLLSNQPQWFQQYGFELPRDQETIKAMWP